MLKRTGFVVVLFWMALTSVCAGCVETIRCEEGEVFDEAGECGPIEDSGPLADAGPDSGSDAGP